MENIRVVVAAENEGSRACLSAWLEMADQRIRVVGEATSPFEIADSAMQLQPDILLIDSHISGDDFIATAREIKARVPSLHIVILTWGEDCPALSDLLTAGGYGYVSSKASSEELVASFEAILGKWHPSQTLSVMKEVVSDRKRNVELGVYPDAGDRDKKDLNSLVKEVNTEKNRQTAILVPWRNYVSTGHPREAIPGRLTITALVWAPKGNQESQMPRIKV